MVWYYKAAARARKRDSWKSEGDGGTTSQREKKSLTMDMNQHMSGADLGVGHVWTDPKLHSKSFETEATLELLLPTVRQNLHAVLT